MHGRMIEALLSPGSCVLQIITPIIGSPRTSFLRCLPPFPVEHSQKYTVSQWAIRVETGQEFHVDGRFSERGSIGDANIPSAPQTGTSATFAAVSPFVATATTKSGVCSDWTAAPITVEAA